MIFTVEKALFSRWIKFFIIWLLSWLNSFYFSHRKFQLFACTFKSLTWFTSILMWSCSHSWVVFIFVLRFFIFLHKNKLFFFILFFLLLSIDSLCSLLWYYNYSISFFIFLIFLFFHFIIILCIEWLMIKFRNFHYFRAIINH